MGAFSFSKKIVKELVSIVEESERVLIALPTSDPGYDVTKELLSPRHFPAWKMNVQGGIHVTKADSGTFVLVHNHVTKVVTALGFHAAQSDRDNVYNFVRYVSK